MVLEGREGRGERSSWFDILMEWDSGVDRTCFRLTGEGVSRGGCQYSRDCGLKSVGFFPLKFSGGLIFSESLEMNSRWSVRISLTSKVLEHPRKNV